MKNRININNQINKILIIRLSSIGDIVLTTHLIRNLRNRFPTAQIDYICFSKFQDILIENKRLTNLHTIPKKFLKNSTKSELTNHFQNKNITNYDILIDLHKNKHSKKIRQIILKISDVKKPKVYKINKLRLHKLSLILFKKPLRKSFQIPELYFETTKDLGLNDDGKGLEVWLPNENEYLSIRKDSANNKTLRIAVAPGAAHFTKRYPKEKFREVMRIINTKYNVQFVLLGGENDKNICNFIEKSINNTVNFCGKLSLLQTIKILNDCDLLITNDTGIMHIASARQIPTVAIFGSSVRELGFTPFRSIYQIVEHEVWCRPCSHIGRDSCPLGHFKCMNEINPSEVVQSASYLLNKAFPN